MWSKFHEFHNGFHLNLKPEGSKNNSDHYNWNLSLDLTCSKTDSKPRSKINQNCQKIHQQVTWLLNYPFLTDINQHLFAQMRRWFFYCVGVNFLPLSSQKSSDNSLSFSWWTFSIFCSKFLYENFILKFQFENGKILSVIFYLSGCLSPRNFLDEDLVWYW